MKTSDSSSELSSDWLFCLTSSRASAPSSKGGVKGHAEGLGSKVMIDCYCDIIQAAEATNPGGGRGLLALRELTSCSSSSSLHQQRKQSRAPPANSICCFLLRRR